MVSVSQASTSAICQFASKIHDAHTHQTHHRHTYNSAAPPPPTIIIIIVTTTITSTTLHSPVLTNYFRTLPARLSVIDFFYIIIIFVSRYGSLFATTNPSISHLFHKIPSPAYGGFVIRYRPKRYPARSWLRR
ncbi:uncharacterized protein F4812DRAFT_443072 [Daldinia caldariorum]|uniref:uncharacterized protein n=1 Tax=Daldinia caldariorum TaxID=326644 RepID=UPI0020087165|nr:uncharacterized protein F4812DRAFT_443072 [Daldinia caldariorum]KAI1464346.1 hypothetical protein F4812DRAFT_443072 [Daldinia caldariorum]